MEVESRADGTQPAVNCIMKFRFFKRRFPFALRMRTNECSTVAGLNSPTGWYYNLSLWPVANECSFGSKKKHHKIATKVKHIYYPLPLWGIHFNYILLACPFCRAMCLGACVCMLAYCYCQLYCVILLIKLTFNVVCLLRKRRGSVLGGGGGQYLFRSSQPSPGGKIGN